MAPQKPIKKPIQPEDHPDTTDDLDYRLQEMPDQSLRRIFCGLAEARKNPWVYYRKTYAKWRLPESQTGKTIKLRKEL
jgi:hypothetical protein